MADAIARLQTVLAIKTAGFTEGLGRANASLDRFSRNAGRETDAVLGKLATKLESTGTSAGKFLSRGIDNVIQFRGAISASIGLVEKLGRGFARVISEEAPKLDNLAKTARKLGIDPTELRGLRFAGGQAAGVSEKTVDDSLQRLFRRIGEVGAGDVERGTGLGEVFKKLNLDVERLKTLAPQEVIAEVADAFKGIENRTEQLALAQRLFGREGVDMVNLLDLGSDGIKRFTDQVKEMGGVVSDQELQAVEGYNDALDTLDKTFTLLKQRVVVDLAPTLQSLAETLSLLSVGVSKALRGSANLGDQIGTALSEAFGEGSNIGSEIVLALTNSIFDALPQAQEASREALSSSNVRGRGRGGAAGRALAVTSGEAASATESGTVLTDTLRNLGDAFKRLGSRGQEIAKEFQKIPERFQKVRDRFSSLAESLKTPGERIEEQMEFVRSALEKGVITQEQADDVLGRLDERLNKAAEQSPVKDISRGVAELPGLLAAGSGAAADFIQRSRFGGDSIEKKNAKSLRDIARDSKKQVDLLREVRDFGSISVQEIV